MGTLGRSLPLLPWHGPPGLGKKSFPLPQLFGQCPPELSISNNPRPQHPGELPPGLGKQGSPLPPFPPSWPARYIGREAPLGQTRIPCAGVDCPRQARQPRGPGGEGGLLHPAGHRLGRGDTSASRSSRLPGAPLHAPGASRPPSLAPLPGTRRPPSAMKLRFTPVLASSLARRSVTQFFSCRNRSNLSLMAADMAGPFAPPGMLRSRLDAEPS